MRTTIVLLAAVALLGSCTSEPPGIDKLSFPSALAKATCGWIYKCCDTAEQKAYLGTSEADCTAQYATNYGQLFSTADDKTWNPHEAQAIVDEVNTAKQTCPKTVDVNSIIAAHQIVAASKRPGDICTNTWECTTRFCRQGTCANPLPENSPCQATEPCQSPLRCVTSGTASVCKALKPNDSACTSSSECYSGACDGTKCITSPTYSCDGKN
jgi:hypothetical protein